MHTGQGFGGVCPCPVAVGGKGRLPPGFSSMSLGGRCDSRRRILPGNETRTLAQPSWMGMGEINLGKWGHVLLNVPLVLSTRIGAL